MYKFYAHITSGVSEYLLFLGMCVLMYVTFSLFVEKVVNGVIRIIAAIRIPITPLTTENKEKKDLLTD
jgi:hypothetical protein